MPKSERYWLNAAVYGLLGNALQESANGWLLSSVTMWACYIISAGYFVGVISQAFKEKK